MFNHRTGPYLGPSFRQVLKPDVTCPKATPLRFNYGAASYLWLSYG